MSASNGMPTLSDDDYEAIAAAVAETSRGRWFLTEFARRNRMADTNLLLDAIHKLEGRLGAGSTFIESERVHTDIVEMAKTIDRLKIEIAADGTNSRFEEAKGELDDVVKTTEAATSAILEATEQVQEMAWTLREAGADATVCDLLDRRAGDIYTACTFQDLTAQRTQKVVRTLHYLEGRLNALIDAWSGNAPATPAGEAMVAVATPSVPEPPSLPPALSQGAPLSQDDVDIVIVDHDDSEDPHWLEDEADSGPVQPATEALVEGDMAFEEVDLPEPAPAPVPASVPVTDTVTAEQLQSLSAIEKLPTTAKLSLFG